MGFRAIRIDDAARLFATEYPNGPDLLFEVAERSEVISTAKLASQQAHLASKRENISDLVVTYCNPIDRWPLREHEREKRHLATQVTASGKATVANTAPAFADGRA